MKLLNKSQTKGDRKNCPARGKKAKKITEAKAKLGPQSDDQEVIQLLSLSLSFIQFISVFVHQQITCDDCGLKMELKQFEKHIKCVHPKPNLKMAFKNIDEAHNKVTLKLFNCLLCDAKEILEENLMKHSAKHVLIHTNQSINDMHKPNEMNDSIKMVKNLQNLNNFKFSGLTIRDYCDSCDKHIKCGQLAEHKWRFHSKIRSSITGPYEFMQFSPSAKELPNAATIKHTARNLTTSQKWFGKYGLTIHMELYNSGVNLPKLSHCQPIRPSQSYQNIIFKIFKCTICNDDNLLEKELIPHLKKHKQFRIDQKIPIKLVGIKVQCKLCMELIKENKIEKHMNRSHPMFCDVDVVKEFKCGFCDAIVLERYLDQHHSKEHAEAAFESNKFKCHGIKQRIPCTICGRRINDGRTKHNLKNCLRLYSSHERTFQKEIKKMVARHHAEE